MIYSQKWKIKVEDFKLIQKNHFKIILLEEKCKSLEDSIDQLEDKYITNEDKITEFNEKLKLASKDKKIK